MTRNLVLPQRLADIAALAADVRKKHAQGNQLDLQKIATAIDVGLSYDDFGKDFDGAIEYRHGGFQVFINTHRNPIGLGRDRFTLAHEYGHYFIEEHRNKLIKGGAPHLSFTNNPAKNPTEIEANHFASHLLMPTGIFKVAMKKSSGGVGGICKLAEIFNVSIQSAALRYVSESDRPCAIIMFRDKKPPWWEVSKHFKDIGLIWMKWNPSQLPPTYATAAAMKEKTRRKNFHWKANVPASDWFKKNNRGEKPAFKLKETAMRLGPWGVLTVLEAQ